MAATDSPRSAGSSSRLPWILLAVVILGLLGYVGRDRIAAALRPASAPASVGTVSTLTGPGVLQRIVALNRLESVAYKLQVVVQKTKDGTWYYGGQDGQRILLIANGTVVGGVDLSALQPKDVQVSSDGKRIAVTLPPATILSSSVDKTEVFDSQTGAFGLVPLKQDLVEEARQDARAQMEKTACASDVLTMATQNAKVAVENLMKMTGAEQVDVFTTPPAPCAAPTAAPAP